jgi:hypothetical protein
MLSPESGHIVGNGLSTEQDFSPASGHLYTIKSNFNSVDEIRNPRISCYLLPMGCFLGCLFSLLYKDFCIIIILINYLICQYLPFFTLSHAALLDELSNKLQQKEKYFVSLYNNIRAKAYQDLGFRPLTVGRISTLYLDIDL